LDVPLKKMSSEDIILRAVKGVNEGQCQHYETLVQELKKTTLDSPSCYLAAFRQAVRHINKKHETLIGVLLNIDWTSYDDETARHFIEFLADLISVKTFYVKVCIRSLIKQFVSKTELFDDDQQFALKKKCDHIHTALQTIIHIAPLSSKFVVDAVKQSFPYLGKSLFILETYFVQVLQLAVYVHDARFQLLQLLIDKLISVDVLTHRQQKDQIHSKKELSCNNEEENMTKMDQLMTLFFAYIDSVSFEEGVLDYNAAGSLFKDLLCVFEHFMIKTQCTHVQFMLFHMASLHRDFMEAFLATCWGILQDPNYASILRQTSACYLSSFLARAKFVDISIVRRELRNLSAWIHRYIDYQDDNTQIAKTKHGPFYSACQALFYIFVYHHKLLVETPADITFTKSLNLARIVTSRLNPLKYCLESVVGMFARVTRMYQIVFCYSIIERNNRSLENMSEHCKVIEGDGSMGTFFPFDPYMLPKSGKWIQPLYCLWNDVE